MKIINISLDSVDKVQKFVNVTSAIPGNVDIRSGRHTINAKSILGILSLDLTKPLILEIYNEEDYLNYRETLEPFMI